MIERVEVVGYGRPASEVLGGVVSATRAGGPLAPVTVIVPSNFAGLSARRVLGAGLAGPGAAGIANVSFLTPFRLAELLAADLLLDTRPLTNPVLGAAVRRVLADEPGNFAPVADHHATEAAVAGLYAELSNVSVAARAALEGSGDGAACEAVRLHGAIARVLQGFHGEADVARAARDRPDLAAVLAAFGHVVWYLPQPTTAPLTDLVVAVLATAPATVVVGLTGAADADAPVRATCARAGVVLPESAGTPEVPTAGSIVSVTDADEEVRAVVRGVARLVDGGVRLDRIGIFHPAPDPYVGILEQQLAAAGLPCNGPSRRRLADTVAGRTLLGALSLPAERWRRDKVMALASGGPLLVDGEPVHPTTWERLTRRAGVVQDRADWRRKLGGRRRALEDRLAELGPGPEPAAPDVGVDSEGVGEGDAEHERLERIRTSLRRAVADVDQLLAFVERLGDGVAAVSHARGWSAKSSAATTLLHQLLGAGNRHRGWPEREQEAFDRVEDALVRLGALDELEPDPDHEVFVRALTAELDVPSGRNGRYGHGLVYGPLVAAAGHDLDAVFVLGCAEGVLPAPRRDDALLPDSARERTAGELTLRAGRLDDQHRAFLAALAAAPAERRVLTYARGDLRGNRTTLPSRWLLDSAAARAGRPVHATDFAELDAPVVEVVPSFARGLDAPVPASVAERDLAVLARHVGSGGPVEDHPVAASAGRGFAVQAARRSSRFTEWDGNLAGQVVDAGIDRAFSPTRLESWAYCGYRYFLKHVLGLADRDDPERVVDLSPLDRGSAVHLVLERFFGQAIEAGAPAPDQPWTDADHQRLHRIAEEVFAEQEAHGRTGRPLHWRLTQADLLEVLDDFLDADSVERARTGAVPERVELPFGLDEAPPVTLALPDGRTVAFRGRADRVDRVHDVDGGEGAGTDHLVVIDYKTGRGADYVDIDQGDPVREGTLLQLGLYAEAAHQLLGAGSTEAHYWMVDARAGYERRGYRWTAERRARFVDVLGTIVDGIEAGVFLVDPGEWDIWRGTHERCAFCDFDRLCVRDRGEQHDVKVAAPELRRRDALAWSDGA